MARNTGRPPLDTAALPPFADAKRRGGAFGQQPRAMTRLIGALGTRLLGICRRWLQAADDQHDYEEDE